MTRTRIRKPQNTPSNKRDVSPLGASRFEQSFPPRASSIPRPPQSSASTNTDTDTDSAPTPTVETATITHYTMEASPRSSSATTHTSPSLALRSRSRPSFDPSSSTSPPTNRTSLSTTGATSIDRFEAALDAISTAPACPVPSDREAWFLRQMNEEDPYGSISDLGSGLPPTDVCPDGATLAAVKHIPVYDAEGIARPFGSLFDPERTATTRQLIIFIRHIFCGACQSFVRALSDGLSLDDAARIPIPTEIILISCGKPDLLPQYQKWTEYGHFPVYAEPTRQLFKTLGMGWSMNYGKRPEYMPDDEYHTLLHLAKGNKKDLSRAIKERKESQKEAKSRKKQPSNDAQEVRLEGLRKRDILRGGAIFQVGGEFLFEDGSVLWSHRMRDMRGRESFRPCYR